MGAEDNNLMKMGELTAEGFRAQMAAVMVVAVCLQGIRGTLAWLVRVEPGWAAAE